LERNKPQTNIIGIRMSTQSPNAELIGRRAELMAELFLEELGASFVAKSDTAEIPFGFFAGFPTSGGGLNTFAVEVKSTETPIMSPYPIHDKLVDYLMKSNIPVLLLVVDVKRNQIYFGWGSAIERSGTPSSKKASAFLRVTEVDNSVREQLHTELTK
jgi:hypothetical protein